MPTPQAPAELMLFIGRFHPLLVHLPIGFLLLLVVVELLARFTKYHNVGHSRGLTLGLALAASIGSATFGWLLSNEGGYDPSLLAWHKWTGIAVVGGCLVSFLFHWRSWRLAYYLSLSATFVVLIVASHHGGSLTHGKHYLTEHAPDAIRSLMGMEERIERPAVTDPLQAVLYADIIQPVFQRNCLSCHNAEKLQGDLRMDTMEAILKGGKEGPALEPGNAANSHIVKYMLLPVTAQKHMPPVGKPQPTDDEIALIQWWIDSGATQDKKVADLKPPGKVTRLLETMFGTAEPVLEPQPVAAVLPVADQLSGELGISILPVAQEEPWLNCNASIAGKDFGDAGLARLAVLKANLQWLDLGGTKVTDAGLAHIAEMKNLTRLHLEKTAVTDAGLVKLSKLRKLEYLNLYGTQVSDAGLTHLSSLPELHRLYLWQTKVTPDAAKTFSAQFVDQRQVQRWQEEIEAIKARIKSSGIDVNLGAQPAVTQPAVTQPVVTPTASAKPVNTKCPISGKDIDATKTVTFEGKLIAFCCDKCPIEFNKDPKPHIAKLNLK